MQEGIFRPRYFSFCSAGVLDAPGEMHPPLKPFNELEKLKGSLILAIHGHPPHSARLRGSRDLVHGNTAHVKYRNLFQLNKLLNAHRLMALLTFHPAIGLIEIETAVHRAAQGALHVILLH